MREIKFRGKEIDGNDWLIGSLNYYSDDESYYISSTDEYGDNIGTMVKPDTIGQYTGLKDKNGKEIYEGDIVTFLDGCGLHYEEEFLNIGEILFEDGRFYISNRNSVSMGDMIGNGYLECEVVGIIHDNPELLEGESGE